MAKAEGKRGREFEGRWHIVSMTEFDEDFINSEVQAFIEFDTEGGGKFHYGCFRGDMVWHLTTRDGEQAIEWTWEGFDERDPEAGQGWAVRKGDELHGVIGFDDDDDSGFVAKRAEGPKRKKGK